MSTETLELQLKAFRLPSFLAHYAPLADQAAKGGWSHTHYLDELMELPRFSGQFMAVTSSPELGDSRWT